MVVVQNYFQVLAWVGLDHVVDSSKVVEDLDYFEMEEEVL